MRKKQRTEIGIGIGDQVESFNRYHLVVCLIEQSIGRSHSEITRTGKVWDWEEKQTRIGIGIGDRLT